MGLRHALALALIAAAAVPLAGQDTPKPSPRHALQLARTYLARWHDTLTNLVVEEDYGQELRRYGSGMAGRQKRQLRSEVLLLRAPAEDVWLSFRNVIAVDGQPIHDRQKRFDALFAGSAEARVATGRQIAAEGARFNLGQPRTINTPTAALVFLSPRYDANTRWSLDANARLGGRRAWRLQLDQHEPPFAVEIGGNIPPRCQGTFWLEPSTGAILQTELHVRVARSMFRVVVGYGPVPAIREGWVPIRMKEEYDAPPAERFAASAAYSNHRLFRTGARILSPSR